MGPEPVHDEVPEIIQAVFEDFGARLGLRVFLKLFDEINLARIICGQRFRHPDEALQGSLALKKVRGEAVLQARNGAVVVLGDEAVFFSDEMNGAIGLRQ